MTAAASIYGGSPKSLHHFDTYGYWHQQSYSIAASLWNAGPSSEWHVHVMAPLSIRMMFVWLSFKFANKSWEDCELRWSWSALNAIQPTKFNLNLDLSEDAISVTWSTFSLNNTAHNHTLHIMLAEHPVSWPYWAMKWFMMAGPSEGNQMDNC